MSRHALLIGINQYPLLRRVLPSGQTATRDLRGCVNDAHSIATLLRERYGFQTANIQLLTDENATRDGILAGLARLLASVGPDDLAVLFYAGHGSQMPDREGTKPSGWDETLVPHDSGRGAHPNRDITDDEIRLWLLQLCERTRFATLIFDCCHSATLNRSASGSDERSIERDERTVAELPPSPLDSDQLARLQALAQSPEMPWLPSGDRYVMLAACRERETAKEHTHSDGAQVAQAGALTFFLTEALRSAAAGATYRDVFEQASLEVLRRYPTQHPAAEGALDREFFGVKDSPTPLYVLVSKVQGDTVTLDAGEPQGVQLGSEYALYPPGTRELEVRGLDAATVPRLRVTSVGPLRAQGRLLAPGPVAALWRAMLVQRAIEKQWPVELVGTPALAGAAPETANNPRVPALYIRQLLLDSPWLRLARPDEPARLRIHLLAPRKEGGPVPQLGALSSETWAVVDRGGELPIKPLHLMQVARLVENLERLVRHELVAELENPGSPLVGQVQLQMLARDPAAGAAKVWQPLPAGAVVASGARLAAQLVSLYHSDLHIALVQLESDGAITQLYPPVGRSEPLKAGHRAILGDGEGAAFQARFPRELPPLASGGQRTETDVIFKLFVTTQPVDLRRLLQSSATRGIEPLPSLPDGWAAASCRLRILKDSPA